MFSNKASERFGVGEHVELLRGVGEGSVRLDELHGILLVQVLPHGDDGTTVALRHLLPHQEPLQVLVVKVLEPEKLKHRQRCCFGTCLVTHILTFLIHFNESRFLKTLFLRVYFLDLSLEPEKNLNT